MPTSVIKCLYMAYLLFWTAACKYSLVVGVKHYVKGG